MSPEEEAEGAEGGAAETPRSDTASEKQLNFIRSLQRRMTLKDDELAKVLDEVCGVEALEDLGRKEASEVIDELQVRAREKGIDLDAQEKASDKQVGFMKQLKRTSANAKHTVMASTSRNRGRGNSGKSHRFSIGPSNTIAIRAPG